MPHELPKAYDPSLIETRWAEYWTSEKLFHAEIPEPIPPPQNVFTLLLPPPNVTGRLHMGHMLNHTEMDIIVRWHRMRGFLTMWLPGTDHAGIATQMMVERQLAAEGKNRLGMGRTAFIERVWQWRKHYGGSIVEQMRRIGDSVDWGREYFTMDDNLSRAVREAFVRLYEEGLLYRGNYIVNWCPRCGTAISDLEVVHEETHGKLYDLKYPVIGSSEFIIVSTTRPETMLGDTAVAVNANDERYRHLHQAKILLPLMNREIPVILDELANPEFGTGAVKVTPAHDPNDFQAGLRHNLPQITVIDESGKMNERAGQYAGLDRFEARARVLHDLDTKGLLVGVKDHTLAIGKCDRCKTIVEPRLSTQWFVAVNRKAKDGSPSLAERAIQVAEDGRVRFIPDNYKQVYLNWMTNIHDWCISRQLWWGHRIPAWHCAECREIMVAREAPAKCSRCGSTRLEQDADVLDTWFSSGLLPMSAMGWPGKTKDLDAFYPTSLLITGFDILFFWVARMIMMGCHFLADHERGIVPFRDVYIHGLVRDAERQKMSKTKGNVVDPIETIERYGTDATRFTLATMAAPGADIAFSESRTESYRAFANKIWNAARFIFMNVERAEQEKVWSLGEFHPPAEGAAGIPGFVAATLEDRWIVSRFNHVANEVNEALADYRFHEAAHVVYHFFWGEFCDWYVELVKPRLAELSDRQSAKRAFQNVVSIFEGALRLLSPFMPFITEEIWHALYDGKPPLKSIALARYPRLDERQISAQAETEMAVLQDLIVSVRNIRAELKVVPKERLPIEIFAGAEVRELVMRNAAALERLAGVSGIGFVEQSLAKEANSRGTARFDVRVIYQQKIDVEAESERLSKDIERMNQELTRAQAQLSNQGFLSKAPPKVVDGLKKRAAELHVLLEKVTEALDGLLGKKK
jgi:valyl-tRNA synthetase